MKKQILSEHSYFYDINQATDLEETPSINKKYRAWAEIDLAALCHNAEALKNIFARQMLLNACAKSQCLRPWGY